MTALEILFWLFLFIVFYTYVGYGILLYLLIKIKRFFVKNNELTIPNNEDLPEVSLIVAAYNEEDFIDAKIKNSLELDYPKEKLKLIFVTDGSTDNTPNIVKNYPQVKLLHTTERGGKIGAINRAMDYVETPIVIFSDANALLNKMAVKEIVKHYQNPKVGCVSGEKRVLIESAQNAGASEGFYWKYESKLKQWDYELYSAIGAAGELFSVRTNLYRHVEKDTILDDFIISLRIAQEGYIIAYEPNAYAQESASENIAEEKKRKVRISAGGIQSILRLKSLFNIFKFRLLSFQFISHRVLRWTITPWALPLLFLVNIPLINTHPVYKIIFVLQVLFYLFALVGWILANKNIKVKILYIPYYFLFMNYCVILGQIRHFKGQQSAVWERAKRAQPIKV
jgi:cellulose synthase/poly-beta-1,6-N-acetylglucosamine synthase-like glycosyltransferase